LAASAPEEVEMWVGQATSDRVYLEGSSSETNPVPYLFAVPVPAARVA
jgi:hypothetical protein